MVIFAFSQSFLVGVMVFGWVIWRRDRENKVQNQLDACLEEDTQPLGKFKTPTANVEFFIIHENCIIEKRGSKFYIVKPNGEFLKKEFDLVEDAKEEIDVVSPLLPPKPDTRQEIHNIRFVK